MHATKFAGWWFVRPPSHSAQVFGVYLWPGSICKHCERAQSGTAQMMLLVAMLLRACGV